MTLFGWIGIILLAGFYARWWYTVATDRCTEEERERSFIGWYTPAFVFAAYGLYGLVA